MKKTSSKNKKTAPEQVQDSLPDESLTDSPEPKQEKKAEDKQPPRKLDEPDFKCRSCKHYLMRGQCPETGIVEALRLATNNGRKTYCGEKPLRTEGKLVGEPIHPRIDCTGKTFELDES